MSGSTPDRYLDRLADAVSHFGDAVLSANVSPDRIHELADRLEDAKRGEIVSIRIRSRKDAEDGDTRTTITALTRLMGVRALLPTFGGMMFAAA